MHMLLIFLRVWHLSLPLIDQLTRCWRFSRMRRLGVVKAGVDAAGQVAAFQSSNAICLLYRYYQLN